CELSSAYIRDLLRRPNHGSRILSVLKLAGSLKDTKFRDDGEYNSWFLAALELNKRLKEVMFTSRRALFADVKVSMHPQPRRNETLENVQFIKIKGKRYALHT